MTAQSIRDAALFHFARDGYEGASLRAIADEVGIKKPSIYAHFSGKEDLFMHTLDHAFQEVRRHILEFFREHAHLPMEQRLRKLPDWFEQEYQDHASARLMLRNCYYPPPDLYTPVMDLVYPFLDGMERALSRLLQRAIRQGEHPSVPAEQVAIAYMTFLDGITVEIIYGSSRRYKRRLNAAWPVFWHGVRSLNEQARSIVPEGDLTS
ncbi:TetR/AcrR family transcriptional regulator [Paenibacillus barcinonensis]|uniref:TetR family transcriptional regulator n=2 Tax=Paenibacillus barcinonensis TaxID=198119 RepID=A0A2V4VBW1_PAEBA|nr:TetR/AcrR family transcriptional regulator [Paenibacillus barcinonensis]PYE50723.1 TetR family transcriptional regulator [Paenibacillus barcinonensis]QKS57407.1 TetR/AcrR family transcriptional regulator [Paenibacillus barcinonensis]